MHAQTYLESRRYDEVEAVLDDATGLLAGLPETEASTILSEIAALRTAVTEAVTAEEIAVNVRRAERELRNARSDADAGVNLPASVVERIDRALGYLRDVPEAAKFGLLADVARLRARIGFNDPAPAPAVAPVAHAVPGAEPTDDEARLLSMARTSVVGARASVESRRYADVEPMLQEASQLLANVAGAHKAALLAEIDELRAVSVEASMAERIDADVRVVERELRSARSEMDSGAVAGEDISERIDRALRRLRDVPEAAKASLLADGAELRARLEDKAFTLNVTSMNEQPVSVQPSGDDALNLSRAQGIIIGARSRTEAGRTDGVAETLQEAADLLVDVPDELKASLLADIEEIRAAAAGADAEGRTRRLTSELDRYFSRAEDGETSRSEASADAIAYLTKRLAADDVRGVLSPDALARYQTRLVEATLAHAAMIKSHALERAAPVLTELEEAVRTNPFVGRDQDAAYAVTTELRALKDRVLGCLRPVPEDDPDVLAVKARIAAADQRIETAADAWALAAVEAGVVTRWRRIRNSIEGWEAEVVSADVERVEAPRLPMTERAMRDTRFWLGDQDAVRIREEYADNAVIAAAYRAAQEVYDGATTKLNLAFVHVLDEIDKLPSPTIEREREVLGHFESAVESVFEDTNYHDALLARVGQIRQRWEADYAAMLEARQELYDRLSVEADTAWPGIVTASGATEDFDLAGTAATGKTVLLAGVYNRAGWEFNGYGFCTRFNGLAVGGSYEPYVLRALEHAWYELKLDVSDRIAWDLIGVVEGPGKIGERTEMILRDPDTNLETGKIEQWLPVDCIRLRITAVHAGPVAVGAPR